VSVSGRKSLDHCQGCQLGKQIQLPCPSSESVSQRPFDFVHSYICGPTPFVSKGGHKYYIIFIDGFSRHTLIYFIKHYSEALSIYRTFSVMICTHFDTFIHVFHVDSVGEYLSDALHQVHAEQGILAQFSCPGAHSQNGVAEQGILAQFSCPGAHSQNGVAEHKHRRLLETTRALMITSFVPPHFWAEANSTATYLINIQPSSALKVGIILSVFVAERLITPAFIFFAMCAMCFLHLMSALS
jgi:transposase InsO family protein